MAVDISEVIVYTSGFKGSTGRRKAKMKSLSLIWYTMDEVLEPESIFFLKEDISSSTIDTYKKYKLEEIYEYAIDNDLVPIIDVRLLRLIGDDGIKVCRNNISVYNIKSGRKIANRDVDVKWLCEGELTPDSKLLRAMDYPDDLESNVYTLKEIGDYAESINRNIIRDVKILLFKEK